MGSGASSPLLRRFGISCPIRSGDAPGSFSPVPTPSSAWPSRIPALSSGPARSSPPPSPPPRSVAVAAAPRVGPGTQPWLERVGHVPPAPSSVLLAWRRTPVAATRGPGGARRPGAVTPEAPPPSSPPRCAWRPFHSGSPPLPPACLESPSRAAAERLRPLNPATAGWTHSPVRRGSSPGKSIVEGSSVSCSALGYHRLYGVLSKKPSSLPLLTFL